ncbi:MAG: GNAT family N-acetyltransferase [Gemmatimonadales bacterium]
MTVTWSIVEYAGRDGLMRLEADWARLVAAMPDAGYEHLHETHVAYLDRLPSEFGAFSCLALSDGTRIRAICPVEPQKVDVFRAFNSPVWGLPRGLGDMPRDLICPDDSDAESVLLPCVARHLSKAHPRRSWFVLGRVLEGSGAWRCLRAVDARRYYVDRDDAAHLVDCDRPFTEITSRLSRKFRANMRSAHNRLARLPGVSFVRTVDAACMDAAFERFLEVEASGWKGQSGDRTAVALKPKQLAFYRDWVAALTSSGRCEFNELRAGETCIASTFCIHVDEQCAVVKIGYDERFAQVAPGHLVLERIFQQYCEDPSAKRINLVSAFAWNARWEPEVVGSYNIYLGIGGLDARARVGLLRISFKCWPVVKRWLQRSGAGVRIARRLARR